MTCDTDDLERLNPREMELLLLRDWIKSRDRKMIRSREEGENLEADNGIGRHLTGAVETSS